ncbi:MAG: 3-hydroxyacyl-CoA dehydrogenase [Sphingomonas bacterium]|nr:3-hydroxyacyl-CoA dehydrogenase [Sphingomonas bacterium]
MRINTAIEDGVARIRIDNPPVNALSVNSGVVAELTAAVRAALADSSVAAIVIHGGGKIFCGGADIADFDSPGEVGQINALLSVVENADKAVVIALHGAVLGGGLELAMAGHYRICTPETRLGLPEVTLGLLPGGGGTQRLPRLVGIAKALDIMLGGKAIPGREALAIGLADRLAEAPDHVAEATRWAKEIAADGPRRTGDLPVPTDSDALAAARAGLAKRPSLSRAPAYIVDCVAAAASGSLSDGLAVETRLFNELLGSDASKGLRHALFGQRQVARIPGFPVGLTPRAIERVAVIGAGTMGAGIATALLNAGLPVTLIDPHVVALSSARKRIAQTIDRDVQKGRLDNEAAVARMSLLSLGDGFEAAADADLIIEAVFEDIGVKRDVFQALDRLARPEAILASNTSTLDLDVIAGFTARPDRVVGLHFFSPANIMRLLEVVRGKRTSPEVLEAAMRFARRIGKIGVVAGVCDGFIGNRIFEEYLRQAFFLLEEGALPIDVDTALQRWGMSMGPLRTLDLAGQDIGWSIRKRRAVEQPERPYSRIPDLVCEMGRFGEKTGAGFYRYPDGRTAEHDPAIDELVLRHSADLGIARRKISDEEIVRRCIFAMVNEGARIVAEGIAYRPVDIDIIYLNGYGFPAARGGPMHYADRIGLPEVLRRIRDFAGERHGWAWEPAPLLVDLVERGVGFASLNDEKGGRA